MEWKGEAEKKSGSRMMGPISCRTNMIHPPQHVALYLITFFTL
ncbi:hypothetical protein ES319_A05G161700v1 [Gossypium barbadense]|uniref:Uncharacterized protein n=2 Tax=Gossypium TaxID=3633 RepID=A0A5J5VS80_GOSBA|nr:hypothetical protein ES319_A05G161700v1 [Gossypium barbadense]TYH17087.1 hypothetical protein ES288_A05G165600v1 [Gossypium darwinii]